MALIFAAVSGLSHLLLRVENIQLREYVSKTPFGNTLWKPHLVSTLLFCLKVLYLPLVSRSLSVFRCTSDAYTGDEYVDDAAWIKCTISEPPWSW